MKHSLRKSIRRTLAAMPRDVGAAKSRTACEALLATEEFQAAHVIMLYAPIPMEVDAEPIAHAAWQEGKSVLAPKVNWRREQMVAVAIASMDDLVPGRFGIREPAGGEAWPADKIDFIIVPALAYDRRGNRLGRGGGFYDRFLAEAGCNAVTCGLAFDEQLVDQVPIHDNDIPVNMLVTDKEVLRFH